MRERATLPISARLLILSTGAAAAYALGVRLADAPSWTMKDVLAFAALTVAIAVAEQFSIPHRHRELLPHGRPVGGRPAARPSQRAHLRSCGGRPGRPAGKKMGPAEDRL